ncbi:ketopantoate reductase family protein [Ferrimonas sediminicola]|uniref:ketopantoate reductase family protein n=1 Tax=Ferrimonas sediminicola TaxID=2569538 RepID=UPI00197ACB5E|nr:2-dehydropantoate 2-reductase [Ferrimonas sediminicola]
MAEPIALLGGGAIGQLLAALLARQGVEPVIIGRPGTSREVREHQLTRLDGKRFRHRLCHLPPESMAACQALLVTTKAYQAEQALTPLLPRLCPQTPIVLLHNGMGPQQRLAQRHPDKQWWAGTLTDGALREAPCSVRHTGLGQRFAGPLGEGGTLPQGLAAIGFEMDRNIHLRLWQKLAVNALINPLTALHRCRNGELTRPEFLEPLTRLSQELVQVAASQGVVLDAAQVLALGLTVAEATAANRSSMLSDIEAQRKTEIEAISGYVVTVARSAGLEAPAHHDNLQQVLALEAQSLG